MKVSLLSRFASGLALVVCLFLGTPPGQLLLPRPTTGLPVQDARPVEAAPTAPVRPQQPQPAPSVWDDVVLLGVRRREDEDNWGRPRKLGGQKKRHNRRQNRHRRNGWG